jgi:3-hydroxyisobutyrate dehydrogenase-like beta-hydroxyacid dehydrogenase
MTNTATTPGKLRVGVIGLGLMGNGMAGSLLRAGFPVIVWNRSPEKSAAAIALGARSAASIEQLASESDIAIIMVSDDAAVREVVHGAQGILAGSRNGLIVINCSTVHPATNQQLAEQTATRGIVWVEAPVTGSRQQAETGKLYFLVGGPASVLPKVSPLFEAMGRGHIHLGEVGAGSCAKLGNNLMGFINLCGIAEALDLSRRFGLPADKFLEVVSNSGGRSAFSDAKGPKILSGNWSPDFALKLAAKDLRLAQQFAHDLQHDSQLLTNAADLYTAAAEVYGDQDVCSLVRWYRERTA